ncbi:MAG: hypothetical protein FJ352_00175 [Firmicutes bacterium]|nr:hypothetical protein [Bacillota bacterium]
MNMKKLLALFATTLVLAGCLGPQTYFSDVFNTMNDLYFPILDNQNRITSNFEVEAVLSVDGKTTTYEAYFFGTGIKLVSVSPETNEGVETTRTLTIVYDYAEGGLFAKREFANAPNQIDKVFDAFEADSFNMFDKAVETANSVFSEETKSIINNQATNLVIGGQPETKDVKVYTLPVGNFLDLASFEDTVGFVPTDLDVVITFTSSTNEGEISIGASGNDKVYEATITFRNPDLLVPANYLLSDSEKATYEGFVA